MSGPEILDIDTERGILFDRLTSRVTRICAYGLNPALTAGEDMDVIADMAVTVVLQRMRVMSARQVAVLLGIEANRHEGWTITEPPEYAAAGEDR